MRGYDIGSFEASECQANASSSCPAFDRLLGSRMLVGNVEFRFPLLRPFGVRSSMYGPLAGRGRALRATAAWRGHPDETPTFFGGHRKPVASAGVTLRINLFGFAVGQLDFARPLQRPRQGWMFEFSLTPGF